VISAGFLGALALVLILLPEPVSGCGIQGHRFVEHGFGHCVEVDGLIETGSENILPRKVRGDVEDRLGGGLQLAEGCVIREYRDIVDTDGAAFPCVKGQIYCGNGCSRIGLPSAAAGTHTKVPLVVPSKISSRRLSRISDGQFDLYQSAGEKADYGTFNTDVTAHLRLADPSSFGDRVLSRLGASPSLVSSFASVVSGRASGAEREQPDEQAANSKIERPLRPQSAFSRSIRSLPLGAKIGVTIFLTLGATGVWCVGFIGLLERRSNVAKALSYGLLGLALFGCGFLPWW
jgi:hypothetical protein